jgi:hypothetical protein
MKIDRSSRATRKGVLMLDLAIALSLLAVAMMPVAFSFARETRSIQGEYYRAAAMEIVDGEAEILAAGAGKNYPDGAHDYDVHSKAAPALPEGKFTLTKTGSHLRLEWKADHAAGLGAVVREVTLK